MSRSEKWSSTVKLEVGKEFESMSRTKGRKFLEEDAQSLQVFVIFEVLETFRACWAFNIVTFEDDAYDLMAR